ncbi:diacylglycerol O-acyltransferase 2-like, partial [Petromyzon marinus]|uniref:diacylglycerol O-acyltransferase 2-like n=1 Tax=Petromyzon marinus TaxID=7757 RepID=UPI003F6E947E
MSGPCLRISTSPGVCLRRVAMETHLRTLVMVKWLMSFVALGMMCQLLLLYTLLWTRLWPLALLYYTWWFTDINTPYTGGRRSQWVRSWAIWNYLRDYFPVKLVKTCDLPSDVNLVLALHPHGVLSVGAFLNFATEATDFSRRFPGLTPHLATLPLNFRMPLYRDYIMAGGVCPATRASLSHRLSHRQGGQLVALVVGGAAEALATQPGRHQLALGTRRGFLRLALTNG